MTDDLNKDYQAMAVDTLREAEALEWCNGLIGDAAELEEKLRKEHSVIEDF